VCKAKKEASGKTRPNSIQAIWMVWHGEVGSEGGMLLKKIFYHSPSGKHVQQTSFFDIKKIRKTLTISFYKFRIWIYMWVTNHNLVIYKVSRHICTLTFRLGLALCIIKDKEFIKTKMHLCTNRSWSLKIVAVSLIAQAPTSCNEGYGIHDNVIDVYVYSTF
jgi:hypothetical protein